MSWIPLWRSLVLVLAGVSAACSLLVDVDGLAGGVDPRDAGGSPDGGTLEPPDARADGGADADAEVDAGPGRVTDGLVALFSFREDGGVVVHDTAPGGDQLELVMERAPAPDGDGGVLDVATSGPTIAWTAPGMSVEGRVLIASTVNATKIQSQCAASGEITVEAWAKPASLGQGGPARIVTMSSTGSVPSRNFTLGQDGDHYIFRLRDDGIDGGVVQHSSDGGVALALTQIAVTARANDAMTFWIDGARTSYALPKGKFDFQAFRLALANEIDGFTSERLWRGNYRLVAIYCRALSEAELRQNRQAGP